MTLTALDHIALVVRDLDAAVDGYSRLLGRKPDWLGAAGETRHAWFQLGNTALDLIAPADGPARGFLDKQGEGVWGLAFATDDIAAERRRLERISVASTEPASIRTTNAAGEHRRWPTSLIDRKATHGAQLMLIGETETWPEAESTGSAAVTGLDHVVVSTQAPERAAALYGARLGLDFKLDRTNPDWGSRLMFFKVGDLVVEVAHRLADGESDAPDSLWGLSWRVPDVGPANARMIEAGLDVSEVRQGRKPGTAVFTVRDAPGGVPTLVIGPAA